MSSVDEIKLKRSKIIILIKKELNDFFLCHSLSFPPFAHQVLTSWLSVIHNPHRQLQSYRLWKRSIPLSLGGVINGNTGKAFLHQSIFMPTQATDCNRASCSCAVSCHVHIPTKFRQVTADAPDLCLWAETEITSNCDRTTLRPDILLDFG